MTIKFGNITKTLTGKIRLQRRSKMKTGVLRSSNPYLEISLTINHQLCTFLRDKTTSLPCPSHTLCISQEHTNEATCTRQHSRAIQFLHYFINCQIVTLAVDQFRSLGNCPSASYPNGCQVSMSHSYNSSERKKIAVIQF